MSKIKYIFSVILALCVISLCTACMQIPDNTEGEMNNLGPAQITLTIGEKTFIAPLADNATASAFASKLPLTLDMDELSNNEKYHYLSEDLPSNPSKVSVITAGELMLYGSNCVVLFYENLQTRYSYTKIGSLRDISGLSEALGSGSVQITFSLK